MHIAVSIHGLTFCGDMHLHAIVTAVNLSLEWAVVLAKESNNEIRTLQKQTQYNVKYCIFRCAYFIMIKSRS